MESSAASALARALAPRPRLVLLDEPFSGLDAHLRAETREAVLERARRRGRRPPCSSPTTRPRRCRWDTRSPFSARDGSSRRPRRPSSTGRRSISTSRGSSAMPSSLPGDAAVRRRRMRARTSSARRARPSPGRGRGDDPARADPPRRARRPSARPRGADSVPADVIGRRLLRAGHPRASCGSATALGCRSRPDVLEPDVPDAGDVVGVAVAGPVVVYAADAAPRPARRRRRARPEAACCAPARWSRVARRLRRRSPAAAEAPGTRSRSTTASTPS